MKKIRGTWLVEFNDDTSIVIGNNYKPWWQHAVEYTYSTYKNPERGWRYEDVADKVKAVKFSATPFFDDGGLKWASPKGYDQIIVEVAKRENRQAIPFLAIDFEDSPVNKAVLTKKLKEY